MKLKLVSALFIFISLSAKGQENYTGTVINKKTREKVAFASVGLVKENAGINADENGRFILISGNPRPGDTLIVSSVGFKTLKYPVDNYVENSLIELEEKNIELTEVIVSNRNESATLNDFSNCGNNYISSSGYQTQLAQHFQVPGYNGILTKVRICRMSIALLSPEKTRFRIRIYDMDTTTGGPGEDLCDQIIEIKTKEKSIYIDLDKYKIRIPNKDFFVAIEWLKIPFNENEKITKMANGNVVETITYRPSIGWSDNQSSKMQAWMLDYKGKWRPMFKVSNKTNVAISATVKY